VNRKEVFLMIVVRTYKSNAWYLASITTAIEWEDCIKQLKYYFSSINRVREKILAGEILNTPYTIFQRGRRINKEKRTENEQRSHLKISK